MVVMRGGAGNVIVIDSCFVTVVGGFAESRSWKVGENVPEACGCPLIKPDGSRFRPGGNDPVKLHVYGVVPPVPLSANE